jgi:hypothetical protein
MGIPGSDDGRESAGDLLIKINWDFDTTSMQKLPWLKQMKEGMHQRAPWTNNMTHPAHKRCLTTDEYEEYQRAGHQHESRHPFDRMHASGGEEGGKPECVQS